MPRRASYPGVSSSSCTILVAPHGRIAACMVTPGLAHDSPIFRKMFARTPDGDGHVMLDSAYDAHANCKMIYDSAENR